MRPRRWAVRTIPAAVAALLAAAAIAPVQAGPPMPGGGGDSSNPGIVYRTVYSRPGSNATVEFSVACPDGMRPLGGGAQLIGATTEVLLQQAEPVHNALQSGFFVAAVERAGGYSGTWQLRAVVACGPAYPNLTYVRAYSATDSSRHRVVEARCPAGLTRVGMGASIESTSHLVHFIEFGFGWFSNEFGRFESEPDSARAIASELPPGTTATWRVIATVVCASPPPTVVFHGEQHGVGTSAVVVGERCGAWDPDVNYVTGVGGAHSGNPDLINLTWYIDDDREVGVMAYAVAPGDLGPLPGRFVSMVCVKSAS